MHRREGPLGQVAAPALLQKLYRTPLHCRFYDPRRRSVIATEFHSLTHVRRLDFTKRNGLGGESVYGAPFEDEDLSRPVDAEAYMPFCDTVSRAHILPRLLVMANRGPNTYVCLALRSGCPTSRPSQERLPVLHHPPPVPPSQRQTRRLRARRPRLRRRHPESRRRPHGRKGQTRAARRHRELRRARAARRVETRAIPVAGGRTSARTQEEAPSPLVLRLGL